MESVPQRFRLAARGALLLPALLSALAGATLLACSGAEDALPAASSGRGDAAGPADSGTSSNADTSSNDPSSTDARPGPDVITSAPGDAPADAAHDAAVDHASTDPSCVHPVWGASDTSFVYDSHGGYVEYPLDASCTDATTRYAVSFHVTDGTASVHESLCDPYLGPTDRTVLLDATQAAPVLAALNQLSTDCPSYTCGYDAPTVSLTVGSTVYSSDFYAGCDLSVKPPYVSFYALEAVGGAVTDAITAACGPNSVYCVDAQAPTSPPDGG